MAFEKAKVLKAAEKFLSQGKINSAIKEYRQIVDNDSDDLTTLNMLGDLYVRSGKKEEAVSCFERIAEHYGGHGQGFIECHHTRPVHILRSGERTRLVDPAPLLARCQRMMHSRQQWLSFDGLGVLLRCPRLSRRSCWPAVIKSGVPSRKAL